MRNKEQVIVVHPGTQHSYQTALAVQKAGLLKNYYTSLYYKPGKFPFNIFEKFTFKGKNKFINQFKRRFLLELDINKIILIPLGEMVYLTCSKISFLNKYSSKILGWRNRRFCNILAKKISKDNCKAVICYDSSALEIFKKAKEKGVICVLDQTIAHYSKGIEILKKEEKYNPEFADTYSLPANDIVELLKEEMALADYILVGSSFCKDSLIENSVLASKIKVIPYGVNIERFGEKRKKTDNIFRILFVGGISQRKGIKYLLEAFKQLQLSNTELILVGSIIGSGEGLEPYKGLFTHVPQVSRNEIYKYFNQADIFVFPTIYEGSAIVTYEALASGLPVITTPNAGSVVRNEIDGFVVPVRNIEILKDKIRMLYENNSLRRDMSKNAKEGIKEYSWEKYYQRIGDLLEEILVEG